MSAFLESCDDLSGLNHLLKASSKEVVLKLLNLVFLSRNEVNKSNIFEVIQSKLELEEEDEAAALYAAALECIKCVLESGELTVLKDLFDAKGGEVSAQLKKLVAQCISANLSLWREASDMGRISLPHLVDMDWTIIVKKASSQVQHMNVPALLVELDIEQIPDRVDEPPRVEKVGFELSKETLDTMLDGLGRIRDQLGAMGE
mmetsp:Transcript_18290/g.30505  ORF Transcript_18290/g.30505 Transcript_18290/m.30505 type:complete len:203 (+) Transcript_18290:98-706(+)